MRQFHTLYSAISDDARIKFANTLRDLSADGWEVISSGCEKEHFWAILSKEDS